MNEMLDIFLLNTFLWVCYAILITLEVIRTFTNDEDKNERYLSNVIKIYLFLVILNLVTTHYNQ